MKIVFATNNAHKLEEARRLADGRMEILSLADIGCLEELPETHDTIEGNSLEKSQHVFKNYGYPCFSDDTGLFVEALDDGPGVYTARYAGPQCSPDDNIDKMLEEMKGREDRKAVFRTVVSLCCNEESLGSKGSGKPVEMQFKGEVAGTIARCRQGDGGFGYDPIFIPDESGISFAEMSPEAKNEISHRGRALRKLFDFLLNHV